MIRFFKTDFLLKPSIYGLTTDMIRFDVNGSDHANPPNNERIPTPHIHIYTEEYNNGVISIPLKDIEDLELTDEIIESLDFLSLIHI